MWKDNFQCLTLLSTKLRNTLALNSLDKLMQLVSMEALSFWSRFFCDHVS